LSTNATSCSASGNGWSGAKATGGPNTQSTGIYGSSGLYNYTISCFGPGGSAVASASVTTTSCGNSVCETGETVKSCPVDCKTKVQHF
jgi:hypothetical protein